MNFPENFWEISGENFREFSEFRKFPRNFPESFLGFPYFHINKKIDFRAVALHLHQNFTGILQEHLRRIYKLSIMYIISEKFPVGKLRESTVTILLYCYVKSVRVHYIRRLSMYVCICTSVVGYYIL